MNLKSNEKGTKVNASLEYSDEMSESVVARQGTFGRANTGGAPYSDIIGLNQGHSQDSVSQGAASKLSTRRFEL